MYLQETVIRRNLLIVSIVLLLVSIFLALPMMDTATQYMVEQTLKYSNDYIVFLLPVILLSFSLQFWLFNKHRWLSWLLPILSFVLITAAELFWIEGGWDRLESTFFWIVGFPMVLGSCLAILSSALLKQNRSIQIAAVLIMVAVLLLGVIFWPRYLTEKIEIAPENRLLYFEPENNFEWMQEEGEKFTELLNGDKVSPCLSSPPWDNERGIMLRLDKNHILIAHQHDTPYIYEYAGELEEFDGGKPKWMVFGYPALYGELRMSANWIVE